MLDAAAILDIWAASSQEGMLILDTRHRIQRINLAAIHLMDLPGAPETWIDRPVWDLTAALRRTGAELSDSPLVAPEPLIQREYNWYGGTFSNALHTLQWQSLPVKTAGDGDSDIAYVIIIRDVTDRQRLTDLQRDLNTSLSCGLQEPLHRLDAALKTLLENIPAESAPPPAELTVISQAHDTVNLALSVVETLIEIGDLKSGITPLSPSAFSLTEMADDALKGAQTIAAKHHLQLRNQVAPTLRPIWGDRDLIQRVLRHLVNETAETCASGDTVTVKAVAESSRHEKVRIAIQASAPDHVINEEPAPYGERPTCATCQIAFVFCQAVLEAHSERLWVSRTPQRGRAVMFTLPQVTEILQEARAYTRQS
jgi:light-regulated signal transduction histidine kinase (bacteriophytochrome)